MLVESRVQIFVDVYIRAQGSVVPDGERSGARCCRLARIARAAQIPVWRARGGFSSRICVFRTCLGRFPSWVLLPALAGFVTHLHRSSRRYN